jgi:hypothetical protein
MSGKHLEALLSGVFTFYIIVHFGLKSFPYLPELPSTIRYEALARLSTLFYQRDFDYNLYHSGYTYRFVSPEFCIITNIV